jgi:poly(3-hydroxybutyrate) depolymerase
MSLIRGLRSCAAVVLIAAAWRDATAEPVPTNDSALPAESTVTYVDAHGASHVYLVQEPRARPIPADTPILIYMHGAGGKTAGDRRIVCLARCHDSRWRRALR